MAVFDAEVRRLAEAATRALERMSILRAVYIFGSYAEGRADPWSDLDLAAFVEGAESWDLRRRARAMAQVQQEVGKEVEAHFFAASLLEDPQPGSFAAYILEKGVCVFRRDDGAAHASKSKHEPGPASDRPARELKRKSES